jgi:hypothetical protein
MHLIEFNILSRMSDLDIKPMQNMDYEFGSNS